MLGKILSSPKFLRFLTILEVLTLISGLLILYILQIWTWGDQLFAMGLFSPLSLLVIGLFLAVIVSTILLIFTRKYSHLSFLKFPKLLRIIITAYTICGVLIIGLFSFMIYAIMNEPPPQLFPLDDPQAIYTITKNDKIYGVHYKSTSDINKSYSCTWEENQEKSCEWILNNDIESYVDSADISLDPYIGVPVELEGVFIYSEKQCIAGICGDYSGSFVGLKIKSIKPSQ